MVAIQSRREAPVSFSGPVVMTVSGMMGGRMSPAGLTTPTLPISEEVLA